MGENRRTTYRISEAARELGISAEWLRVGEKRGLPPALRDRNGHRYYTEEDIERMLSRSSRAVRGPGVGETNNTASLKVCIGRLALREESAVRERDWSTARRAVLERVALQEYRCHLVARRWSSDRG